VKNALRSVIVILAILWASPSHSNSLRTSCSFGASVYGAKPVLDYRPGGETSIPANYALTLSAQTDALPLGLLGYMSWDRLWSGSTEPFVNSSNVLSAGIGKSFTVGYSRIEALVGLCHYDEQFKIHRSSGGSAEIDHALVGGFTALQWVFRVTDSVSAVTSYRLILRGEEDIDGQLDDGWEYSLKTNTLDHVIAFGLGYEFGQ